MSEWKENSSWRDGSMLKRSNVLAETGSSVPSMTVGSSQLLCQPTGLHGTCTHELYPRTDILKHTQYL